MKTVNLNEYVKFKLTDKGNKIIENHRKTLSKLVGYEVSRDTVVKVDRNGYEYLQLWEFMKIFSDEMRNGQEPLVENNNLYFE